MRGRGRRRIDVRWLWVDCAFLGLSDLCSRLLSDFFWPFSFSMVSMSMLHLSHLHCYKLSTCRVVEIIEWDKGKKDSRRLKRVVANIVPQDITMHPSCRSDT